MSMKNIQHSKKTLICEEIFCGKDCRTLVMYGRAVVGKNKKTAAELPSSAVLVVSSCPMQIFLKS